jgi:cytoskeleton protein RodZ
VAEISDRLHLPPRLVNAIENDDFADLPGTVFTQGYLRNYARLVGESPDDILKMFSAVKPRDEYKPALRQFQLPMKANQVNSSHGLVKTMTWLIIIALLILLIVWWRGYIKLPVPMLGEQDLTDNLAGAGAGGIPPRPTSPSVGTGSAQVSGMGIDRGEAATEKARSATVSADTPVTTSGPLGVAEEAGTEPATEETAGDDASPAAAPPAAAGSVSPGGQPGADSPERPPDGGDGSAEQEIVMAFDAPCWVDIRDAAGTKILFGAVDAGETHSLSGMPPFQVLLGNSSAVRITIGGRAYPTDVHSRGNVARFLLDPAKYLMAANGQEP